MSGGLDRLLQPRSVAIVGLSEDPAKHGARVLRHLRALGFAGPIWGVHPKARTMDGVRVVASVADLPEPPDVLVCAVPGPALSAVLAEAEGAGAAVAFGGGFGEAGEDGRRLQEQLVAVARETGIRVLGPNSAGVIRPAQGVAFSFLTCLDRPAEQIRSGTVALVTQSGGTGSYVHNLAAERGGGLAVTVSTGNEADIRAGEVLCALAADDAVRAIAVVLEAVRDGANFIAGARAALRAGKPVVVLRLGTSGAGQAVMRSHTGALAGARRVSDGVLDALGVARVETPAELLEVSELMARSAVPAGGRVGVVTHSGGTAVLLADLAATAGLDLPQPPPALRTELDRLLDHGAAGNPLDMGAIMAGPHRFGEVARRFRDSGAYDAVLAVSTPHPPEFTAQRAETLAALGGGAVPVLNLWLAGDLGAAGLASLRAGGAPVTDEPRAAVRALAGLAALARETHTPSLPPGGELRLDPAAAPEGRRGHAPGARPPVRRLEAGPVSTEAEAKDLLRAWGLPVVPGEVAVDPEAAVAAAERLGYPVVLKVVARDLAHKSEVGGVLLDLRAADAVRAGWQQVLAASPGAEGVLVERYRPGVELVLGCVHDPVFGPVVALGLGGVLAEALDDVAVAPAPVTPAGAARMAERLRGRVLLDGFRGQPPADLPALHHLTARLSERFAAAAAELAEVEINPLVAGADGWLAVDALVRRG